MANNMKKRAEFFSDAKKLRVQQELLEKHTFSLLNNLNSLFEHENLKISNEEIETLHRNEKNKCNSDLTEIKKSLVKLKCSKDMPMDIQHLKSFLNDITNSVMTIKEASECVFEKLSDEEETYMRDLEILERKIDDFVKCNAVKSVCVSIWEPPVKSKLNSRISQTGASAGTNKEVEAFQQFLQASGGRTGGWDSQDHQLFLKHRQKLKGPCMEDALHIVLPDIPLEAIVEHEEWFKQHEILRANQKLAIKNWREACRSEAMGPETGVVKEKITDVKVNPAVMRKEAEKKKQQIREWKSRKQELKLIETQKQSEQLQKLTAKQNLLQEKQEWKKQAIVEYQLKKVIQKETYLARETRAEEERFFDQKLVSMFRERDRLYVAKMLERIEEAKYVMPDRLAKDSSSLVVAQRNPDRLLRPTEAWSLHVEKQELSEFDTKGNQVNYIEHLPHLKVPSWRKNL